MSNPKHLNILTKLLAEYLDISYEELLGKVEVVNPEIPLTNIKEKRKTADLIVKINREDIVNIEINLFNKDTNRVRNFLYLTNLYNLKYDKNDVYKEKGLTIQINFSSYSINKEQLHEIFYLQDDKENKYLKDFRIDNINIDFARKMCYNEVNNNLVKWCMILTSNNLEELDELIGESVDMEDKENLKESLLELSNDRILSIYYDEEKEKEKLFRTGLAYAEEEGFNKGKELGIKEGINQSKKDVVLNMLKNNISKDIIANCTNLSIDEIEKLDECLK